MPRLGGFKRVAEEEISEPVKSFASIQGSTEENRTGVISIFIKSSPTKTTSGCAPTKGFIASILNGPPTTDREN